MIQPTEFQKFDFVEAGFCDAQESLSLTQPILMNQVHSADVFVLDATPICPPKCDAFVTQHPKLKLTVKTADCAPVLFLEPKAKIIAAAHAGWKGAFQGILENTLLQMIKLGADISRIYVAIGPHLTQKSFQVSENMYNLFPQTEHRFFTQQNSGLFFDFTAYLIHRLKRAGIQHIQSFSVDTFENNAYNSYRRNKENPARQYSFIELK